MKDRMKTAPSSSAMVCHLLGMLDYSSALALQQRLVYETAGRNDGLMTLLVCEHPPEIRRHQRNDDEQSEEGLRDACVKDSDFIFHHRDAKTTENSL